MRGFSSASALFPVLPLEADDFAAQVGLLPFAAISQRFGQHTFDMAQLLCKKTYYLGAAPTFGSVVNYRIDRVLTTRVTLSVGFLDLYERIKRSGGLGK